MRDSTVRVRPKAAVQGNHREPSFDRDVNPKRTLGEDDLSSFQNSMLDKNISNLVRLGSPTAPVPRCSARRL